MQMYGIFKAHLDNKNFKHTKKLKRDNRSTHFR